MLKIPRKKDLDSTEYSHRTKLKNSYHLKESVLTSLKSNHSPKAKKQKRILKKSPVFKFANSLNEDCVQRRTSPKKSPGKAPLSPSLKLKKKTGKKQSSKLKSPHQAQINRSVTKKKSKKSLKTNNQSKDNHGRVKIVSKDSQLVEHFKNYLDEQRRDIDRIIDNKFQMEDFSSPEVSEVFVKNSVSIPKLKLKYLQSSIDSNDPHVYPITLEDQNSSANDEELSDLPREESEECTSFHDLLSFSSSFPQMPVTFEDSDYLLETLYIVKSEIFSYLDCINFVWKERDVDSSIQFIIDCFDSIVTHVNQEELLNAINNPIYKDPLEKLSDIQNSQDNSPSPSPVLPDHILTRLSACKNSENNYYRRVYLNMVFSCINEALEKLKPYGQNGHPQVWSRRNPIIPYDQSFESIVDLVKLILTNWEGIRMGNTENMLHVIRLLTNTEIFEADERWMNYEDKEMQVSLNLSQSILQMLTEETIALLS